MLKLTLKYDWDSFPSFDKKRGRFIGRQDTKNKLVNDFLRKSNGSILVSGARGVGKTALVYQALQDAQALQGAKEKNRKIIPIILNAAQLNPEDKELKKSLLQGFIRRLYTALRDKDLEKKERKQLNTLYKKAIAITAETYEKSSNLNSTINIKHSEKENRFSLKTIFDIFRFLVALVLIIGKPLPELYNSTLILLFLIPNSLPTVIWNYIAKKIAIYIKTDIFLSSAEETYIIDNNPDNIEYDLNEFLESIKKDYKIIFVLDELDKYGTIDDVFLLIQKYKNLFSISSALFVFITDHNVYNNAVLDGANDKNNRSINHTLFNDRLFLTRPNFNDLESFLEQIVESPSIKELNNDTNWDDFKNYLCFRCKTDFFDLYLVLRDYIKDYDKENRPILILDKLKSQQLFESKIQKIIGQIYDAYKKAEPTQWNENDNLLSSLYSFMEYGLKDMSQLFYVGCDNNNQFIKAKTSLCDYLARLGLLTFSANDTRTVKIENITFKAKGYKWIIKKDFRVPKTININLEYECSYIRKYNHLLKVLNSLLIQPRKGLSSDKFIDNNIDKKHLRVEEIEKIKKITQFDFSEQLKRYKKHYNDLKKNPPIHIPKDELETVEKEIIISINNNIYLNINKIFANCIIYHGGLVAETNMIQNKADLLFSEPKLRQKIIDNNIKHIVLYNKNLSKQAIMTKDIDYETLNELKKLIKPKKNKIKLINFQDSFGEPGKEVHNLNTKKLSGIDKNIDTVGVINILVDEEFKTFNKTIQYLRKWFKN